MTIPVAQGPPEPFEPEPYLALTEAQRQRFDEDGFILIEDALSPGHVDRLIDVVDALYEKHRRAHGTSPDAAYQIRNSLALHDELFALIEYPKILPLVVDVMGVNIQIRTSHVDVRPPMEGHVQG